MSGDKRIKLTVSARGYKEQFAMFFKLLINGVNGDRLKELQKIRDKHDEKDHKLILYKALSRHILEKIEYRLPLWLPLSLEEKLDMLIH